MTCQSRAARSSFAFARDGGIKERVNSGAAMPSPRLLIVEGNTAELRARQVTAGGQVMSEGYADLLRGLLPNAVVDICYPADPGANLPIGGLEGSDGVAI